MAIPDTQLPAFRLQQRITNGYDSIDGHIDGNTLTNKVYIICLYSPTKRFIQYSDFSLVSGTVTMAIGIGNTVGALTNIFGMSALAVTSTPLLTEWAGTDGSNIVLPGQVIAITASANALGMDLDFSIGFSNL